jgi:enoyl-CoA hydratase
MAEKMSGRLVIYEKRERVGVITLNRPEKRNALNRSLYVELDETLRHVDADTEVRAVVLTGAGPAFSAGADLNREEDSMGGVAEYWEKRYQSVDRRQFTLWEMGKPIVAAVHGYCLGRGLELALWCDIVVASEDAKLGQPEVRQGDFVASIVPWLIGPQRSKLFMLTGDQIDASEAERIGLVTRVVPSGQALSEALKLAKRLTYIPPITARSMKRWINGIYGQMGLHFTQDAGAAISALITSMTPTEKNIEELECIGKEKGLKAFLEARDAPFRTE